MISWIVFFSIISYFVFIIENIWTRIFSLFLILGVFIIIYFITASELEHKILAVLEFSSFWFGYLLLCKAVVQESNK